MGGPKPAQAETPFQEPTRILWITSHHYFTKSIRVLDLTQQLLPTYRENDRDIDGAVFRHRLQELVTQIRKKEDKCDELLYTLEKEKWNSSPYYLMPAIPTAPQHLEPIDVVDDGDDENDLAKNAMATWRRSSHLSRSFRMQFPPGSPHSTHPVDIKPGKLIPHIQIFVKDSIQYAWEMESGLKDFKQTLFKVVPQRKIAVALFRRLAGWRGARLLLVDEKEGIDHVVVTLSSFGTFKGGGG